YRNEWDAILQAAGKVGEFAAKYGEANPRNVESFLFFDLDNASSIASCVSAARENGRIVRTALTSQVWDALNQAHQEMAEMRRTERSKLPVSDLVDWTKRQASLLRGAIEATQLRNDGYSFLHLGFALERADATARLLDVKYYVLLPEVDYVGSGVDNYQWSTLLRAMSLHRAFSWAYGGEITPGKIADFLILNHKSPRSLVSAVEEAREHLERLARGYGRSGPAQSQVRSIVGELSEASVDDIFDEGLHEFLTRFIEEIARLGFTIHEVYLSGEAR
ncbi:MAG: alpha-E domain-containing protein, partial [Alphaproteobacteria bacterium]|nr:alpha-E domain-containing protein [Alphaproteobacteria bacterium]